MKRARTILTGVAGSPYYNNLFFGDSMTDQDVADAAGDLWAQLSDHMVNDVFWNVEPVVVTIDPVSGNITSSSSVTGPTGQGVSTTEKLPDATQIVIQWRTGVYHNGREIRGRTFIPGLADFTNDEGNVALATRTAIQSDLDTWLAAQAGLFFIWSRKNGLTAVVSDSSVWNEFGVLRSRRD